MRLGRLGVLLVAAAGWPDVIRAATTISATRWHGFEAFQLATGSAEAVVVPGLMRVVRFAGVDGRDWLWTSDASATTAGERANWGGEKPWLAPELQWPALTGSDKPDPSWERGGTAETGPEFITVTGPVSATNGMRMVTTYSFDADGAFVIRRRVEKVSGPPVVISSWSNAQVGNPDAAVLPVSGKSVYRHGFHDFGWGVPGEGIRRSGRLLLVSPDARKWFKLGVDAPVASLAAVKGRIALVMSAKRSATEYPDGPTGYGCPVELWNDGDSGRGYMEFELLSPLTTLAAPAGTLDFEVRWRVHALPAGGPGSPAVRKVLDRLLFSPVVPGDG